MSEKPENPPAFPSTDANEPSINGVRGMTLRDYFAAAALQGFCANAQSEGSFGVEEPNDNIRRALNCYAVADAMLKARQP